MERSLFLRVFSSCRDLNRENLEDIYHGGMLYPKLSPPDVLSNPLLIQKMVGAT